MRAVWRGQILAEADKDELIRIEGNWYFPADSIKREYFKPSEHRTVCPWKGQANYYDIEVAGQNNEAAAWFYPEPKEGATERVGRDFTNYIAFWHDIEVVE